MHQPFQDILSGDPFIHLQLKPHALEVLGIAQAVDAGDGGHYYHIPAREKRSGGGQPHLLYLGIDEGVLLYVLIL